MVNNHCVNKCLLQISFLLLGFYFQWPGDPKCHVPYKSYMLQKVFLWWMEPVLFFLWTKVWKVVIFSTIIMIMFWLLMGENNLVVPTSIVYFFCWGLKHFIQKLMFQNFLNNCFILHAAKVWARLFNKTFCFFSMTIQIPFNVWWLTALWSKVGIKTHSSWITIGWFSRVGKGDLFILFTVKHRKILWF